MCLCVLATIKKHISGISGILLLGYSKGDNDDLCAICPVLVFDSKACVLESTLFSQFNFLLSVPEVSQDQWIGKDSDEYGAKFKLFVSLFTSSLMELTITNMTRCCPFSLNTTLNRLCPEIHSTPE